MSKKALIAEPDTDEARKQGAILSEDGYEVQIARGGDLLEVLAESSFDVVLLRHERPGQNGLALLQRIKKQARFGGTAVVLTTSDLPPESIERHKEQQYRADAYVRLPLRRQDLLAAARSLPEVVEAADVDAEQNEPDVGRPPPLPHNRPSLPMPGSGGAVGLSHEELSFFEDMFSSIQEVPDNARPEPEIPIPTSGPDRKLALLRAKLREYETKMGRLKVAWRARENDFRQAQSIVEQKGMEGEGLALRIKEMEEELEEERRRTKHKEAEWGRQSGEQWDERSLQEAKLINQVAGKEHEVHKLERKLRQLEEDKELQQKALSERVFEWERAYKRFEEHHWAIIDASEEEVRRLERALDERDARHRERSRQHVFVESSLALQRARLEEAEGALRRQEHERAEEVERVGLFWWKAFQLERSLRLSASHEKERLERSVLELEEALHRHATLLAWLEKSRRAQVMQLSALERQGARDLVRTRDELSMAQRENSALSERLSTERALGEAAIHKLFFDNETQRIISEAQIAVRDARLTELLEEEERLNEILREVTERLGEEEAHHADERDRADELERVLAQTQAEASSAAESSALEISALSGERDWLTGTLEEKSASLAKYREELDDERKARHVEQQEVTLAFERKESELRERTARASDLERDLESARDDSQQLRGTVSARDERICELLARVREDDEAIVRLEAQGDRLTTTVAELRADIDARAEREADLEQRLHGREQEVERLTGHSHTLERRLEQSEQAHQRSDAQLAATREALLGERSALADTRASLEERESLLSTERELAAELRGELGVARAEVEAGATLADELQAQVRSHEERLEELRAALKDRDLGLSAGLARIAALEGEGQQLTASLQAGADHAATLGKSLEEERAALAREREGREQLQSLSDRLRTKLAAADQLAAELEEQVSQLSSQNGSLTKTVVEHERTLAELEHELATASVRGEEAARQAAGLEAEARAQATRLEEEAARLREQDAELTELRSTQDEQRLAIDERSRWIEAREARIAELTAILGEEQRGRGEANARADDASASVAQLHQDVAGLRAALEAEQERAGAALAGAESSLAAAQERAAALAAALREGHALASARDEELARLRPQAERLSAAETRVQGLEAELQDLRSEWGEVREHTASLQTELQKAQEQVQAAQGAEHRLRAELAEAKAEAARQDSAAREAVQKAELGARRMQEAQQLLAREKQSHEAGKLRLGEVERRLESVEEQTRRQLEENAAAHDDERQRLMQELNKAKKGQRDAQLKAQQIQQQYTAFTQQRDARLKAQTAALKAASTKAPGGLGSDVQTAPAVAAAAAPIVPAALAPAPAERPVAPPAAPAESGHELEDVFAAGFDEATRIGPEPVSGETGALMPSPDLKPALDVYDDDGDGDEDEVNFDEATQVVTSPGAFEPSKPDG
jgi:chromosome segregation ATPase/CheY-like chemotaxis protein